MMMELLTKILIVLAARVIEKSIYIDYKEYIGLLLKLPMLENVENQYIA